MYFVFHEFHKNGTGNIVEIYNFIFLYHDMLTILSKKDIIIPYYLPQRVRMLATIKDVAAYAGVSKTLVSRYINGQGGVGLETSARIEQAIKALDYRPNILARSLVQRRTYCIGVTVDDLSSSFVMPLIAGLEQGVSRETAPHEYTVIYTNSCGDPEKKKRQLNFLSQGHVDGLIIYGSSITDDNLTRQLFASGVPLVIIENELLDLRVNKVLIDNVAGAFDATEHLIRCGHKKIAHFGGDINMRVTLDRMNGFMRALQKYGIRLESDWMIFPEFAEEGSWHGSDASRALFYKYGYNSMKQLLQTNHVPSAAFFATDIAAYGAIRALNEAGLRVPEDMSIIGFDDESAAASFFDAKPISTMRQPLQEAGSAAIDLMIQTLEDPHAKPVEKHLRTQFIDRQTTAAPNIP